MGKRHDQSGAILSAGAMDEQGAVGCRERLEKTRKQIDVRPFERQPNIEVGKVVSNGRCTQIAFTEKGSPGVVVTDQIAADHPTAVGPGAGRVPPAFDSPTQV